MSQAAAAGWDCFPGAAVDVPGLAVLCEEIFPSAWTQTSLHLELQSDDGQIWLARAAVSETPELAGFVVVRRVLDEIHVHALGVSASLRRQGVAAALMNQVLGWARVNAIAIVHLEQRASNHASRELYGSLGFVVVGRRPRYYRDGEDALLLSLVLVEPSQTLDPTPGDA